MSLLCKAVDDKDRKPYIVYLGSLPNDEAFSPLSHQIGMLERVMESTSASNFLIRRYKRSFNGFAAKLTDKEIERLANMKEVVSVFPSTNFQLHTSLALIQFTTKDVGLKSYLNSTKDAQTTILKSEAIKDPAAPIVVSFSSRGPNSILPEIIKPDISAPGVDILAAFSLVAPFTNSPDDERHVKYSLLSGSSVACPRAAAAAAYIRTFHPEWSPAAIKLSLMTTAWLMNHTNDAPSEFAHGSGHINLVTTVDPGLMYKASEGDYIKLLCSFWDDARVKLISGENIPCPKGFEKGSPKDFNYPSLAAVVEPVTSFTINFNRTVKNVGHANSTYKAKIIPDSKVDIKVVPEVLSFKCLNEEKAFTVTVVGKGLPDGSHASSSLI